MMQLATGMISVERLLLEWRPCFTMNSQGQSATICFRCLDPFFYPRFRVNLIGLRCAGFFHDCRVSNRQSTGLYYDAKIWLRDSVWRYSMVESQPL